jgi:hypothetical protein
MGYSFGFDPADNWAVVEITHSANVTVLATTFGDFIRNWIARLERLMRQRGAWSWD